MVQDKTYTYNGRPIVSRYDLLNGIIFNDLGTTSNPYFKVMRLFDAEYLRNGMRYRHSYNDILIGTYTLF